MYDMTDLFFNTGGVCEELLGQHWRVFSMSLFVLSFLYPFFLPPFYKEYPINSLVRNAEDESERQHAMLCTKQVSWHERVHSLPAWNLIVSLIGRLRRI